MNFVEQIYQFNEEAGLLEKPYDDFLEASFQIEEALEGFEHLPHLAVQLGIEPRQLKLPKEISRSITKFAQQGITTDERYNVWNDMSDVDRLDKACDAIVFAVGSIAKLRLTPDQLDRAMDVVCTANLQKLSMPKDKHGKLQKPADFADPEAQLQQILDER